MKVKYDPEADAAYIALCPARPGGVDHVQAFEDRIIIDFDQKGNVLGIDILGASELLVQAGLKEVQRIKH